jgi:hypothetical protein
MGTHGSVVGWGTMLQDGKSPVRVPDEVDFFNLPTSSSRPWGRLSLLQKWVPGIFLGVKKRPARSADNLAGICEPNVWKFGSLNLSQP